jgi:acylphosphatase
MKEVHLIIKGRVQGVGLRAKTREEAKKLGLTGFAHNLDSGDVEIVAQGEMEDLEGFLKELRRVFKDYIDDVVVNFQNPDHLFESFSIY